MDNGSLEGIALSSRIRLARNISGYPFPFRLDADTESEIIEKIKKVFINDNKKTSDYVFLDLSTINEIEMGSLVEKHLISPDFAVSNENRAVIISKDEKISLMINEEDHIRLQCMFPGADLDDAWELSRKIDDCLEEQLDIAFDNRFGYITSCPTNIGTGLRASVMLHLPALFMTGHLRSILEACIKLGIVIRGLYGENSEALGNIFQISNQITLGVTEDEVIRNIENISGQIIKQEESLRASLYEKDRYSFEDRIYRSYGIISNARKLDAGETLKLLSDIRIGVDMGILKGLNVKDLDNIMVFSQPSNLQKLKGRMMEEEERDIVRAELVRNMINGNQH